jgi:ribosome-associated toxin RatA of RatAB toxin-antitoxin module
VKTVNIPRITGMVCTSIILNMINLSFTLDSERTDQPGEQHCWSGSYSHPGYKPVLDECPNLEDAEERHDSYLYKEWCKETFTNGKDIYEGYKDIAFNIKYAPETARTDNWQTPQETTRLEQGDCEDAVFLFFSHLPPTQENAEIVWGWVIDKQDGVARAHVWYQLKDRKGKEYIVEGFSNDWTGIIPMEIVSKTETRKPILKITHLEASRLLTLISRPDSWDTYQLLADLHRSTDFVSIENNNKVVSQDAVTLYHLDAKRVGIRNMSREYMRSWNQPVDHRINTIVSNEISKIFRKLHELFTKYEKQAENSNANLQIAYGNTNHFRRNLNCRR